MSLSRSKIQQLTIAMIDKNTLLRLRKILNTLNLTLLRRKHFIVACWVLIALINTVLKLPPKGPNSWDKKWSCEVYPY
jgi:hypothetical protein